MSKKTEFEKAINYAYWFLSLRQRTVNEMEIKLGRKGFSKSVVKKVITHLQKLRYLDDQQFAENWVEERLDKKPRGKILLHRELISRGIDPVIATNAIEKIFSKYDELELALQEAVKKLPSYAKLSGIKTRRRLYNFLWRRGFSYEVIRQVLREFENEGGKFPSPCGRG